MLVPSQQCAHHAQPLLRAQHAHAHSVKAQRRGAVLTSHACTPSPCTPLHASGEAPGVSGAESGGVQGGVGCGVVGLARSAKQGRNGGKQHLQVERHEAQESVQLQHPMCLRCRGRAH
eukprot:7068636-Pyramimonas_sp.AAC.2